MVPYDGLNRRIVKAVTNSGDLNCTYHYYYDKDWRVIEQRNASNFVLKQMVWAPAPGSNGSGYTDELVQVRVNNNLDAPPIPAMSQTLLDLAHPLAMYPGDHWVLQDANYNVLGLVDYNGKLVERYEYSPYGERKVFVSAGNNDAGCYAPTLVSWRRTMYTMVGGMYDNPVSVPDQPFGLCEFGHQGLMYEEHLGNHLMDVRHRIFNIPLARWNQTDPYMKDKRLPTAGDRYHDGMNSYEYIGSSPLGLVDPTGLCKKELKFTGHGMSTQYDITKKTLAKGERIPEFMSNGIQDGSPMLTADDVKAACDDLCCDATLLLYGCGMGKNPAEMRALAAGCPKIKKVCGYTELLRYLPFTEITFPLPWNWNCINVN